MEENCISSNIGIITIPFLQDNQYVLSLDGHQLSRNKAITDSIVKKFINKDLEWGLFGLSMNQSISFDFVMSHSDKDWHWGMCGLSLHPELTLEFIQENQDKECVWG